VDTRIDRSRKLLPHNEMLEGIALAPLHPGPEAANVVACLGYRLPVSLGALVSTTGVILPRIVALVARLFAGRNLGSQQSSPRNHWKSAAHFLAVLNTLFRLRVHTVPDVAASRSTGLLRY
jgi:hypothetical protein